MQAEPYDNGVDKLHAAIHGCTGKYALCLLSMPDAPSDMTQRVTSVLRPGDHLIVLAPGRIALVLDNLIDVNHAHLAGIRLQRTFSTNARDAAQAPAVTCGFAYAGRLHPEADTVSDLCTRAEAALESAARHKQCFEVYTLEDAATVDNHWQINLRVKTAIESHEIRLDYQPRIDLASGAVVGAEAIIRWRCEGEVIPPAQYLPALTNEVLWELTVYCYRRLLRELIDHDVQLPITMQVPVSCLMQIEFFEFVQRETHLWGIEPTQITFEISELGELFEQPDSSARLAEIRALGCKLTVSDFSTALVKVDRLAEYEFDEMKIDTTLAEHAPPQEVSAFLTHASQNGVTLVADGIENAATLELMRNRGCVSGLGFYLGAPLQIHRLAELIGT